MISKIKNNKMKYALGTTLAAVSLALIVPAAQAQMIPPPAFNSQGLTIVPSSGYGSVPVVIGPNGMQRYAPNMDPYGYYDYAAYNNYMMNMRNSYNAYNGGYGSYDVPPTQGQVVAQIGDNNQIYLGWLGDTRAVGSITFTLLDGNNRVVNQQTITGPPAATRLTLTEDTAGYAVTVQYINGMTTNFVAPLGQ